MTEHYCSKHGKVFFKKGKMRGYAHPIQDENGEDTGEWCNEDAEEVAKLPAQKPISPPLQEGEPTPEQLRPFDPTRKSIERQTALKASVEWCIAKHNTEPIKTEMVVIVASLFESYLENGITVKRK